MNYFAKCKVSLIEKINKIISNMVITIASAVAEVERMSILLSQVKHETLLTMQVLNEHKPHSNAPLHHSWIKPTVSIARNIIIDQNPQ